LYFTSFCAIIIPETPKKAKRTALQVTFEQILQEFREKSFSESDKGGRFERLMQSFLKTLPEYAGLFKTIWLWNEFPSRGDFGSGDKDLGIDPKFLIKN
jgi:predicted helicase